MLDRFDSNIIIVIWFFAVTVASFGLVLVGALLRRNIPMTRSLLRKAAMLPELERRFVHLILTLNWWVIFLVTSTEAFAVYRAWSIWYYHFHFIPTEVLAFDLLRAIAFLGLGLVWRRVVIVSRARKDADDSGPYFLF